MSRSSLPLGLLSAVLFATFLALSPHAAQTPRDTTSADARLRALYTDEWNWRQKELAQSGDATRGSKRSLSESGRRVATGAARVLDAGARDARHHPVRPALARREGERTGLPHVDPRARQRRALPHLRSAVQQRHVLLDRVHAAPGLRHRRRLSQLSRRVFATCRDTSTSRSPTCAPASRAVSPSRGYPSSDATRRSSRTSKATRPIRSTRRSLQMPATIPANDQAALRAEAVTVIRDDRGARVPSSCWP